MEKESSDDLVSIIIPVYNVENYLDKCVDSVILQTYKNIEIILVDDGSDDQCPQICEQHAGQDRRIKIIHKKNGGADSARKAGMLAATGKYVGYVDGDDWIEPEMFEKLYGAMTENNADIVLCGHYIDTGNKSKEAYSDVPGGYYGKEQLIDRIYPEMIVGREFFDWKIYPALWDKLFRREHIVQYQMKVDGRLRMGEDAACTYPALLNADSIYILHECLYHYRQTTTSMVKDIQDYTKERMQFWLLYHSVNKRIFLI